MKENLNSPVLDSDFDITKDHIISLLKKNLIPQIVIHGKDVENKEGKMTVAPSADLDSKVAIYLLGLAGIESDVLTFVKKGQSEKGALNIDTGGKKSFEIEDDSDTIYIDHHGSDRPERQEDASATEMVYRLLIKGGLLKREDWLDELVIFVNEMDNADFFASLEDQVDSRVTRHEDKARSALTDLWWRSMYGLNNTLSFESIIELFKDGRRADHVFTEDEAMGIKVKDKKGKVKPLVDLCVWQRNFAQKNVDMADRVHGNPYVEKSGKRNWSLNINGIKKVSPELGPVLTNIVTDNINKMPLGFTLARGLGLDSYIAYHKVNGGFFISSVKTLDKVFEKVSTKYPAAKLIRGTMIIYNPDESDSTVNKGDKGLDEFLDLMEL